MTRYKLNPVANSGAEDGGFGTLTVLVPTPMYPILVYRLVIGGPSQSIAYVYVGHSPASGSFASISYFGQADDADYPTGMMVSEADNIIVCWYSVASPASITNPAPITGSKGGIAWVAGEYESTGAAI